jgi:hypothetical protein
MSWLAPSAENGSTEVPMKRPKSIKLAKVATPKSQNESTDHEPAVRKRPDSGPAWGSSAVIDDEWARHDRNRGRLKDALLTDQEIREMARTQLKEPESTAESKYEPTDYERTVLAKQAQRLKDQVRAPRIKFVEDQRGGRPEYDHPDQEIAFALLKEVFGTADDQFARGLLHYLFAVLPIEENSSFGYPRADDLNRAISLVAAGNAVDGFHAQILADLAVCRITLERLLHNVRGPIRFNLSEELTWALKCYKYDATYKMDSEVKVDNRPVLEFSFRSVTRLMAMSVELTAAANRYRATFESSRAMERLSAVMPVEASLGEVNHATPNARPKNAIATRARRLVNGSSGTKLQKIDSTIVRPGNGHTPT